MKRHIYTIIIIICSSVFTAKAQQPTLYSLYMLNQYQQNIAYAGLDKQSLSATGAIRRQWNGIAGSPLTQAINAHLPIYYLHGAFGITLEQNILGASRTQRAKASYAYHIPLRNGGTISVGIGGGVVQYQLRGDELRTPDGNYENTTINHQDDFLPNTAVQNLVPDFEAGIYYKSEKMEIGLSSNTLLEPNLKFVSQNSVDLLLKRNYCFIFATNLILNDVFVLKPSFLIRSDIVETQGEVSTIFQYKDNIFIGASFRGYTKQTTDAVVALAGLKLNEHWSLGYAYDWTLSTLRNVSSGSHELILNYNINKSFGKGKLPTVIYNPRFL